MHWDSCDGPPRPRFLDHCFALATWKVPLTSIHQLTTHWQRNLVCARPFVTRSWHLSQEAGGECFAPKKELSWKSWKEMLGAVSTCGKATRYLDSRSIHPLKRNLGIEPCLKIYSSGVLWYWLLPSHLEILEKFHYVTMFSARHARFKSRTSLCSGRPVRPDTWLKLGHWIKESPAFVEWWGQSGQEWTNCQLRAWTRTLVDVFFCMLED